jgi:hypothetical protein
MMAGEKLAGTQEHVELRTCPTCARSARFSHTIFNTYKYRLAHIYLCRCGEQIIVDEVGPSHDLTHVTTIATPAITSQEGEPRHDGKKINMNLIAVVLALVVVSSLIVADHFKGPLFPEVLYCLNDDGMQITRICQHEWEKIAHRNLIAKSF